MKRRWRAGLAALGSVGIALSSGRAEGADLLVDGVKIADLDEAMTMAGPGDRILLPPGVYEGTYVLAVDELTVEGLDPSDPPELRVDPSGDLNGFFRIDGLTLDIKHAILDGQNASRLALVENGATLRLDRVELRNGSSETSGGGALRVVGSALTMSGCNVHDNECTESAGGAVYASNATLVLTDNLFASNTASTLGGAARLHGTATVSGNVFVDNVATAAGGGAIWAEDAVEVTDNRFCGNTAFGGSGGAIAFALGAGGSTIDLNVFIANEANDGGALSFVGAATGENNDFVANTALNSGAAIYVDGPVDAVFYSSLAVGHTAGDEVFGRSDGTLTLDHVGYQGNTIAEVGATNVDQPTPPLFLKPADPLYVRHVVGGCEDSDLQLRPESAAAVAGKGTQEGYGGGAFRDHLGSQGVCAAGTEVPADGLDQDCDGVDDCFVDLDGDGLAGTASAPGGDLSCLGPAEFALAEDCDDDNALVHPGATEIAGDGVDSDCDGAELCFVDEDGDGHGAGVPEGIDDLTCGTSGWSSEDGDCDDDDGAVGPHLSETPCNGVDDDCDPVTEDDADEDGDGYLGCTEDCDDTDAYVSPAAPEQCDNGVDDDCDGMVDEEAEVRPWYLDADGDGFGFGNELQAVVACQRPSEAHVLQGGDCDDADAAVYPGAEERCDGVDNDCDGASDPATCDRGEVVAAGQSVGAGGCSCGIGGAGAGWIAALAVPWGWRRRAGIR